MPLLTIVNSQITDSVTQANTKVLGDAPAIAMGNFMEATSQALNNSARNAISSQASTNLTGQSAITQGVETLYNIDTASTSVATSKILKDAE